MEMRRQRQRQQQQQQHQQQQQQCYIILFHALGSRVALRATSTLGELPEGNTEDYQMQSKTEEMIWRSTKKAYYDKYPSQKYFKAS